MKHSWFPLLACALVTAPVAAQQVTVRSGNWDMLRDAGQCGARLSGMQGAVFTVWQGPTGPQWIALSGQPFAALPAKARLRIVTTYRQGYRGKLKEQRFDANAQQGAQGRTIADPGLIAALWRAEGVTIYPRGKRTILAHFVPAASGFPAEELRRCREDGEHTDRGSGKPKVTPGTLLVPVSQLITTADYPTQALQNEWRGRTTLQLTVSAKGLVSGCSVFASSGHVVLDQKACILYSHRARFSPALDADGASTEALYLAPIVWTIQQ